MKMQPTIYRSGGALNGNTRTVGLDLMRSVAISLVVLQHGLFIIYPYLNESLANTVFSLSGFFGVELFFVLSGYLVGKIFIESYWGKNKTKNTDLVYFWRRRWLRTLPNYYFTFFILIVLYWRELPDVSRLFSYLFFAQNLFTPNDTFFIQAWSLSVEEWFYLLLPVVTILCNKVLDLNMRKTVAATGLLFILGCNIARLTGSVNGLSSDVMRTMTVFKLDSIFYGVLLAYAYFVYNARIVVIKIPLFVAAVSLLLIIVTFHIRFVLTASPFVNFALFNLAATPLAFVMAMPLIRELKWDPSSWFGSIVRHVSLTSYSIYLNHFSIGLFLYAYTLPSTLTEACFVFVLYLVITAVVSSLQYKFIEIPFIRLRDRKLSPSASDES